MYSASAPGTLMLLGEHAVLHDKRAMVCAIDKRIKVTLTPRNDRQIIINSVLGTIQINLDILDTVTIQEPFQFILTTIWSVKSELPNGFELLITSEFSHEVGLGSSAAVVVATLAVLNQFAGFITDNKDHLIFQTAKKVIKSVQGVGSGADVAASVFGGVVLYQQHFPFVLDKFSCLPPLTTVYSGSKTKTPEVIKIVEEKRKLQPRLFEKLYEAMDHCVAESCFAFQNKDWSLLGSIFNVYQGLMSALGVSTPVLNQLIDDLRREPEIYGAKISGSGLGDCIIGVGESSSSINAMQKIPVSASLQGVCYE